MTRFVTTAALTLVGGAAIVLAPPALADSAAPSPRPSLPTVAVPTASVAPGEPEVSAEPRPGDGTGDIEVPAGKADVSASGRSDDLLAVVLAGGGALLLAGGAVVVVSRRRA